MFLYPMLNIKRGNSTIPIQTYLSWEDKFSIVDNKFIAIYHRRSDIEFKIFEEKHLLGNRLFEDCFELEEKQTAYVFDFSEYSSEYKKIIHGKYSMLDVEYKQNILKFFRDNRGNHSLVESWLYPETYYYEYAELLFDNIKHGFNLLKSVGELCSLPNLKEESIKKSIKIINFELQNQQR
jgi:hypothetical protein